ncbi:MAG: hypothetical protein V3S27_10740 [Kiloniellales bacterium]
MSARKETKPRKTSEMVRLKTSARPKMTAMTHQDRTLAPSSVRSASGRRRTSAETVRLASTKTAKMPASVHKTA